MVHQSVPTTNRSSGIAVAVLLISTLVMSPASLRAQAASEVAVVNVGQVLASPLGQSASEQLEIRAEAFKTEIRPDGERFTAAQTDFEEDLRNNVLSPDGEDRRSSELRAMAAELTRRSNQAQMEMQELQKQLEGELIAKLVRATKSYAEENGYRLVIPAGDLLFGDSPPDITAAVIRRMGAMPDE